MDQLGELLSPRDALPDVIPVLGQIDDGGALIGAIIAGLSGALAWWKSKQPQAYRTGGNPGGPPVPNLPRQLPPGR